MLASCPALPYTWATILFAGKLKNTYFNRICQIKRQTFVLQKGTYCHGQGFKIGLNENFPYFSEIQENIFFSDKHTYFVTYTHTI